MNENHTPYKCPSCDGWGKRSIEHDDRGWEQVECGSCEDGILWVHSETGLRADDLTPLELPLDDSQALDGLNLEQWRGCPVGDSTHRDPSTYVGDCFAGYVLGDLDQVGSLVLYWPAESHLLRAWFWAPRNVVESAPALSEHWRRGLIRTTGGDGKTLDYGVLLTSIRSICDEYSVKQIGADPWSNSLFAEKLSKQLEETELLEFRQGYSSMNEPTKRLLHLVSLRELSHGHNPVLDGMAQCVRFTADDVGNMKVTHGPIDPAGGITSAIMAIGLALAAEGGGDDGKD